MKYEIPAFEALLLDQEAGASSLLYRFIGILSSFLEENETLDEADEKEMFKFLYNRVLDAHPLMAIFPNLAQFVEDNFQKNSEKSLLKSLNQFKNRLNLNIGQTVEKSVKLFSKHKNIFTFSHSSIVRKALLEIKTHNESLVVNVLESRPVREGVMLAKVLSRADIKINLFADAAMEKALDMSDVILVGTDWYWGNGFVNKIGTHAILRIAREKSIPFAVLTDSSKVMSEGPKDWSRDEHAASVLFAEDEKNITVYNPYFESMDYNGVSHFIVDGEVKLAPGGFLSSI